MPKFHVWSGSVKVTIVAEDPHAAAVELLQSRSGSEWRNGGASFRDPSVGEQIVVAQPGARRPPERFITLHLLAHLNRQTPDDVWRNMLASFDPNNN